MNTTISVGLVGVGNNASAMVQGVEYYRQLGTIERRVEGIRFPELCGYRVADLAFTCAFDVDQRKIGLDLGEAVFCEPNCYPHVLRTPPTTGARVHVAPVLDGVPPFLSSFVDVAAEASTATAEQAFAECVAEVKRTGTQVLVNFLPSGSDEATRFFARVAATAGAAYVNCTPSPAAHAPEIVTLFEQMNAPLLGDDLESQFGSSLLHRTLLKVLSDRGLEVRHSYQVNLGGNTDFKNLSHRPDAKKRSKLKAIDADCADRVDVLPSGGFLRGLGDNKVGYIVIEGRGWLDMPVTIDLKLKVQDSSNAAGVTADLIRLARAAIDRGQGGYVPFSYYFKNPLGQKLRTEAALEAVERFARGEPIPV